MDQDQSPRSDHRLRGPLILAAGSMLDADAETVVDAASAAGFDGVGLRLTGPHLMNQAGAARIAARCTGAGLRVHDTEVFRIGTDTGSDVTLEPPHGLPAPARDLIEVSAATGAGAPLVVSDHSDTTDTTEMVGRLAAAADHDLEIALEYMAWNTPPDPARAVAIALATGARVVVDVLHHVRVGAGVDQLRAVIPTASAISVEVQSDALLSMAPAERARTLAQATRVAIGR